MHPGPSFDLSDVRVPVDVTPDKTLFSPNNVVPAIAITAAIVAFYFFAKDVFKRKS